MPLAVWDGSAARTGDSYVMTESGLVEVRADLIPNGYSSISNMLAQDPFYVAHRGGSVNWPEMTLEAYGKSAAWGAQALEVSLGRTSDGVYFGLHDDSFVRTSPNSTAAHDALTWAQVQQLSVFNRAPYARWEDIAAKYGHSHVLFIDPKYINRLSFQNELYALIKSTVPSWSTTTVIKLYHTFNSSWGATAKSAGFTTWGYFWHNDGYDTRASSNNFDLLGFNFDAPQVNWDGMLALGKPIIGHVCPTITAAQQALTKGASGIMAANVLQIIPPRGVFAEPV